MTLIEVLLRELRHRWIGATLAVVGVAAPVAFGVVLAMDQDAAGRETRRVMRDLGFNIRIIPATADLDRFHLERYSRQTMSEEVVERLGTSGSLSYNHVIATLKQKIPLGGSEVFILGISDTYFPGGKKKPPLRSGVTAGTIEVGHHIARRLGLQTGASLRVQGEAFTIARVMPESGTEDDSTVFGRLEDVQRILKLEGQINEISAIDCLCLTTDENPLAALRAEIGHLLPGVQILHERKRADARARQRQTQEKNAAFLLPLLIIAAAAGVGVLAALNVRDRHAEIGLLRALGYGRPQVAGLFIGRAVIIGIVGAFVGFGIGSGIGLATLDEIFEVTGKKVAMDPGLLGSALLLAPLLAAAASFVPAMMAITRDPASTLQPE